MIAKKTEIMIADLIIGILTYMFIFHLLTPSNSAASMTSFEMD